MKTKPSLLERFFIVLFALCMFLLAWAVLEAMIGRPAKAGSYDVLLIGPAYPQVPGIEAAPPAHNWYRRGLTVTERPNAGVDRLDTPAPPNGCPAPGFRVLTGSRSERGCFGRQ